jgi:hypothetical protein
MANEQHRTLDLLDHASRVFGVFDGNAAQRVRKRSVHENDGRVSHDQHPPLRPIRHSDGKRGGIRVRRGLWVCRTH